MSSDEERKARIDEIVNPHILTLDQVFALHDENLADPVARRRSANQAVMAFCDRVRCRFSGPEDFNALTYGEKLVWDMMYMEGEVLNGGFHQYLTNSTGETGEAVKRYLRDIGAEETLKLFEKLSAIFRGGKIPRDHETRSAYVKEWTYPEAKTDLFDQLDECFYTQSEDINALILAYARSHRENFLEPSEEVIARFKRLNPIKEYYKSKS